MKIELESPFKEKWRRGYLVTNPENRKNVILYHSPRNSTTISYARYLMSVKIGYIVPDGLEVDHKDDDKTNDDINNLQILTKQQNKEKAEALFRSKRVPKHGTLTEYRYCKCTLCREAKSIWMRQYDKNNAIISNQKKSVVTDDDSSKIKELRQSGLSSYKISEVTGFARNTVMKYW